MIHNMASSSSSSSSSISASYPLKKSIKVSIFPVFSTVLLPRNQQWKLQKVTRSSRASIVCSAVQESSTSTSTATAETKEAKAAKAEAPAKKPKAPAKAPAKPLPQLMEEDVIPALKATLQAQKDLSEIELSFQDNRLDGSFLKDGILYSFWAFFPNGILTGPKGFSLSSYGSDVSTVEPFLIDEKRITAKHIVFWVEKRLAAQGILPVWNE